MLCFCKGLDADSEEEVPLVSFTFDVGEGPTQTFLLKVQYAHGGSVPGRTPAACPSLCPHMPATWSPPSGCTATLSRLLQLLSNRSGSGELLSVPWEFTPPFLCPSPFPLQNNHSRAFRYIKVLVKSNWGHPRYTCLYRVQVHGKVVKTEDNRTAESLNG